MIVKFSRTFVQPSFEAIRHLHHNPVLSQDPRRGAVRLKESAPRYSASARQPRVQASSYRDCVSLHHCFVRHPVSIVVSTFYWIGSKIGEGEKMSNGVWHWSWSGCDDVITTSPSAYLGPDLDCGPLCTWHVARTRDNLSHLTTAQKKTNKEESFVI